MKSSRRKKQDYLLRKSLVMVADQSKQACESFVLKCMSSDIASALLANNGLPRSQSFLQRITHCREHRTVSVTVIAGIRMQQNPTLMSRMLFLLIRSIKSHIVHGCSKNSGECILKEHCKGNGFTFAVSFWRMDSLLMPCPECFALIKATASIVCVKQKLVFLKSLLLEK